MTRRRVAIVLVAIAACLLVWRLGASRDIEVAEPSPKASGPGARSLDASVAAQHPGLAATDPAVVAALESRGLSLGARLGAKTSRTSDLAAAAPAYRDVAAVLRRDLAELSARANVGEGLE